MQNDLIRPVLIALLLLGGMIALIASCSGPDTAKKKANTYAFDQCVEAMLRDGNGVVKTADICGKFKESVDQSEQAAANEE